jgi:putative lipase involved disintegration of autophagic bodies
MHCAVDVNVVFGHYYNEEQKQEAIRHLIDSYDTLQELETVIKNTRYTYQKRALDDLVECTTTVINENDSLHPRFIRTTVREQASDLPIPDDDFEAFLDTLTDYDDATPTEVMNNLREAQMTLRNQPYQSFAKLFPQRRPPEHMTTQTPITIDDVEDQEILAEYAVLTANDHTVFQIHRLPVQHHKEQA